MMQGRSRKPSGTLDIRPDSFSDLGVSRETRRGTIIFKEAEGAIAFAACYERGQAGDKARLYPYVRTPGQPFPSEARLHTLLSRHKETLTREDGLTVVIDSRVFQDVHGTKLFGHN